MRILSCNTTVDPNYGGPVHHMLELAKAGEQMGHTVEFLTLDRPSEVIELGSTTQIHALGPATTRFGFSTRLVPWFRANRSNYDAVIVHTLWRYLGQAVRLGLRGSNIPYYIRPHGGLNDWQLRRYGPLKTFTKYLWWLLSDYRVCRDAECVLFTCDDEQMQARNAFRPQLFRSEVITNGISEPPRGPEYSADAFFDAHPDLYGKDIALFLGRFHPDKGLDNLIRALTLAGDAASSLHLILAGPDPTAWGNKLADLAQECGVLRRVTFAGELYGGPKWAAIRASTAAILPSHSEASPHAIIEAISCGKPVLTTRPVGIRPELEASGCALIDDPSPQGIARMLTAWASMPDAERRRMSQAATSLFLHRFQSSSTITQLLGLIASDARRRAGHGAMNAKRIHAGDAQ